LRLHVEVQAPHAISSERVDAWCRRASSDAPSIRTNLPVAKIIGKDNKHVRLRALPEQRRLTGKQKNQDRLDQEFHDRFLANPRQKGKSIADKGKK
jgi:hypothetical protein